MDVSAPDICGLSVIEGCGEQIEIQEIKILVFQQKIIQQFEEILGKIKEPKIITGFLETPSVSNLTVTFRPDTINDIHFDLSKKSISLNLILQTAESLIKPAFEQVNGLAKICINIVRALQLRYGFIYKIRYTLTNNNQIILNLNIETSV